MRALWFGLIIMQSTQAAAQQVTNDELFAGYCIGVIQQRMQETDEVITRIQNDQSFVEKCPNKADPKSCRNQMIDAFSSARGAMDNDLRRYQSYIAATNVSRSTEAIEAVYLASNRGGHDQVDCAATDKQHCDDLFRNGKSEALECMRRAAPACERTMRCNEASALPF